MTTPADRTPELLAAIAALQQRFERFFEVSEERWQSQREYVDVLKAQVDAQSLVIQSVVEQQATSVAIHKALTEGIINLNFRFDELTAQFEGLNTRVDGLTAQFEGLNTRVDDLTAQFEGLNTRVDDLTAQFEGLNARVDGLTAQFEGLNARVDGLTAQFEGLNARVDGLTAKVDGLMDDIAVVKGGHARSAVQRNAALVADALGCQLIAEVPQGVLLGFAKIAEANGEPYNDVESFKNADMVLHVVNSDNQPGYIAVEASFTISERDVARAIRNADYLSRYTGLPAYPVVAGVDILPDAQERVDNGEARLYRIQRRELQPG